MAAKLDDGDAWLLPSDFFEIEPKMGVQNCGSAAAGGRQLAYEWGRQWDSNLSLPVESAVGTDGEDDYMAGLAQRVAYAMLDDDDEENCGRGRNTKWVPTTKVSSMVRSPQSTLSCPLENWSSKMSGGFSSQLPSKEDASAWLLLNMAGYNNNSAGFERGTLIQANHGASHELCGKSYLRAAVGELRTQYPQNIQRVQSVPNSCASRKEFQAKATPHVEFENAYNGFHGQQQQPPPQRAWNPRPKDGEHNIPINLVSKPCVGAGNCRQGKLAQAQNRGVNGRLINRSNNPSYGPGHMGGGSGMRAFFLGSNGPGRESGGTGVFLPRRMDNGYTAKSKPACSTVLLPARIVQALNLNVENLRSQPSGLSESAHNRRDYAKKMDKRQSALGGDGWPEQKQQQKQFYPGCYESQHPYPSSEISLPQEWTY